MHWNINTRQIQALNNEEHERQSRVVFIDIHLSDDADLRAPFMLAELSSFFGKRGTSSSSSSAEDAILLRRDDRLFLHGIKKEQTQRHLENTIRRALASSGSFSIMVVK